MSGDRWETWGSKLDPAEFERRALARRRPSRSDRIGAGAVAVTVAGLLLWGYIILATVWGIMR